MKLIAQDRIGSKQISYKGKTIPSPIAGAYPTAFVDFEDRILVEYWADKDVELGERNVFAFDADGNILWQIPRYSKLPPDKNWLHPWVSLRHDPQTGTTYVNTWSGVQATLNPEDGSFTEIPRRRAY